tara:strand:- start:199 stop:492 length:294 start_codon:yes stop_codon:yes gene_type:complete
MLKFVEGGLGILTPVESTGSRGRNAVYHRVLVLDDFGRLEVLLLSSTELKNATERADKHFDLAGTPGLLGRLMALKYRCARLLGGLLQRVLGKLRRK